MFLVEVQSLTFLDDRLLLLSPSLWPLPNVPLFMVCILVVRCSRHCFPSSYSLKHNNLLGGQYMLHLGALGSKLCCPGGSDTDLQLPGERHVAEVQWGRAVAVALGKHRQNHCGCCYSPYSHQHPNISYQRWIPGTPRASDGWSWPGNPPGGLS